MQRSGSCPSNARRPCKRACLLAGEMALWLGNRSIWPGVHGHCVFGERMKFSLSEASGCPPPPTGTKARNKSSGTEERSCVYARTRSRCAEERTCARAALVWPGQFSFRARFSNPVSSVKPAEAHTELRPRVYAAASLHPSVRDAALRNLCL